MKNYTSSEPGSFSMSSRAPSMEQELHRGRDSLVTEQGRAEQSDRTHILLAVS